MQLLHNLLQLHRRHLHLPHSHGNLSSTMLKGHDLATGEEKVHAADQRVSPVAVSMQFTLGGHLC